MYSHINMGTLEANDLTLATRFYDSLFNEINIKRNMSDSEEHVYVMYTSAMGLTTLPILKPING